MAAIKELIRKESDNTISFGDYTLDKKTKLDNFEYQGDLYKVKTFGEITKLEKNGKDCPKFPQKREKEGTSLYPGVKKCI